MIEIVDGPDLPARIGPYPHAVRAAGLLFVSGQAGVDPSAGRAAGPTMAEPTRMTMQVTLPLGLLISIGCTALLEG